jgi:hypothetical protein
MKRKLVISLIGIFGFLFGGLVITSYVLAQKLKEVEKERKDEPLVAEMGELLKPKLKPHKFKHVVCDYFPVKIPSDSQEEDKDNKTLCDVSFEGEKLMMVYNKNYYKDVLSIYDHPIMREFKGLPARAKIKMLFEARGPGDINFLLTKKDMQEALLYLLNGMHRKFKLWEKYEKGPYLIYVWDITRGSFKEFKVQLFTDEDTFTCLGEKCVDYLFQSRIL